MNITFDDPRLTAYALDELDEAGRSVIENEMQNFGECHGEVEAIARAAALVRSELASEPMPALTLVERGAIEAKLRLSDSKPRFSWIPSAENGGRFHWRLKTGLAVVVALLICMISNLAAMTQGIQTIFQKASADTAYAMIKMAGTKVIKDGLKFTLPHNMSFVLAPACGSIRENLILLVASLLAGNLYLRSPWKRLLLTLFVIPLAIFRNGFHIFTMAELCVHMGADAISSPIFRQGDLIFFALSFVPFLLFLIWLRKLESKP